MRLLALDFGSKTVGVAVSDALGLTATGVEIIRRKSPGKLRQTLARIEELVKEYQVDRIILGFKEEQLLSIFQLQFYLHPQFAKDSPENCG